MANNVPQPPASSAAKKRFYSMLATNVLIGISGGLLLAPTLGDARGIVSFALLMLAIVIMAFAVTRWPDPL